MTRVGQRCRNECEWFERRSGAAALIVVLFLPALVLLLALVANSGYLFLARYRMMVAADMGALAGLHALDLDRLSRGERYIDPYEGSRAAREWTLSNLNLAFPNIQPEDVQVNVEVRNPNEHGAEDPSITVDIRLNLRLPWPMVTDAKRELTARATGAVKPRI